MTFQVQIHFIYFDQWVTPDDILDIEIVPFISNIHGILLLILVHQLGVVPSFQIKMEFPQQRSGQSLKMFTVPVFQDHPFIPIVWGLAPSMQPVIWHIIEVNDVEVTFFGSSSIRKIKLVISRKPTISQVSDYLRFKQQLHLLIRDPVTLRWPV